MEKSVSIILSLIIMLSVFAGFENKVKADDSVKTAQAEVTRDDLMSFAKKQLGKPYRSGAKGPDAFDCSGFVYYVYGNFGFKMPASSSAYWSNPTAVGTVIDENSTKNAKTGDIISWPNHVAIYTKNGGCIEALNYSYGVIDSFPVEAHASGNGSHYRVIRVKGVTDYKKIGKFSDSISRSYNESYIKANKQNKNKKELARERLRNDVQFTDGAPLAQSNEMIALSGMNGNSTVGKVIS